MTSSLEPLTDPDTGEVVSREQYWGQKQLAAHLGCSAIEVGRPLLRAGLLEERDGARVPTERARVEGCARSVRQQIRGKRIDTHRWDPAQTVPVLQAASQDAPPRPAFRARPASEDTETAALYWKVRDLERRLRQLEARFDDGTGHSPNWSR